MPMFVHWPEKMNAGQRYDHPVSSLDLYPTFLGLAQSKMPNDKKLDGKNIMNDLLAATDAYKDLMSYT